MPNILLVEDNLSLCEVIQRDLKNDGFAVEAVQSGLVALERLTRQDYDAVILDWMLPDIDGLEILRRLQARQVSAPVLMLTARAEEADRVIGLEVGADDYLTKPFSMRELVACLHALLRRVEKTRQMFVREADQAQPTALSVGDLTIEPDQRRVSAAGQEFDLTPIEFALLELFARHPGRVFNRAFLMETVWEQSYIPGDRSVDNAVLRLRKKIYPYGEALEAVWGVGYRLRKTG
jgi:DNA-binding response OmpR family regulator